MHAIQYMDTFTSQFSARDSLNELKRQDGFLGGRVLHPKPSRPGYRVQAFFQDEPEAATGPLPDGCKRVVLLRCLMRELGIEQNQAASCLYDIERVGLYGYRVRTITLNPPGWGTQYTERSKRLPTLAHVRARVRQLRSQGAKRSVY